VRSYQRVLRIDPSLDVPEEPLFAQNQLDAAL
jgi:hypothetical protein